MNLLGYQAGPCRLPLVAPSETNLEKVRSALENTACWAVKLLFAGGAPRRSPDFLFFLKFLLDKSKIYAILYKLNLPEWRNWRTHGT